MAIDSKKGKKEDRIISAKPRENKNEKSVGDVFSRVRLADIAFGGLPARREKRSYGEAFVFPAALADVVVENQTPDTRSLTVRVCNPTRQAQSLRVGFQAQFDLFYVPSWVFNPPVFKLRAAQAFVHFGLPARVGLPREAFPIDAALLTVFDGGSTNPAVTIVCESTAHGVGLETGPDRLAFVFRDGTERREFTLKFTLIQGNNLVDSILRYQQRTPYRGIPGQDGKIIWFFDLVQYADEKKIEPEKKRFDLRLFRAEAEQAVRHGAGYAVVECNHHSTHFDQRYWAPENAGRNSAIAFYAQVLEILTELKIKPLMYYNYVHGVKRLMDNPEFGVPELYRWRHKPADGWAQKNYFENAVNMDMNWFAETLSSPRYNMDTDPSMELRNPRWRSWLCERIRFMLERYPLLAGTYIDTWPSGLPFFGKCLDENDCDFGEHAWWNAAAALLGEIRLTTLQFPGRILLLNDSRMQQGVLAAADSLLNEDAGPILSAEKVFWHCLRVAAVGQGAKPCYNFHHWRKEMGNALRTKLFFAMGLLLDQQYCIWNSMPASRHGESLADYDRAIEEMRWCLKESPRAYSLAVSPQSLNIESLAITTNAHDLKIRFPEKHLAIMAARKTSMNRVK